MWKTIKRLFEQKKINLTIGQTNFEGYFKPPEENIINYYNNNIWDLAESTKDKHLLQNEN